jgi:CDP-diacylglycerol--serine O-phosphatidyltransferase
VSDPSEPQDPRQAPRLDPALRRRSALRRFGRRPREFRRGIFLLPSLFTVANMFCGYACVVHAMLGQLDMAAPFIGFAIVLDMLDGRIARMTGTATAFGLELDSLADVISFGLAPAVLAFAWGLSELGRVGWAAGFIYVSAAAMRLARFNIQSTAPGDKRYFVGMPSPPAAGVTAATVFAWPFPLTEPVELRLIFSEPAVWQALAAVAVMLVPAALMVSTIRFRSFKTINFGWGPSYMPLLLFTLLVALIFAAPQLTLLILAYGYLMSAFIGMAWTRLRSRRQAPAAAE